MCFEGFQSLKAISEVKSFAIGDKAFSLLNQFCLALESELNAMKRQKRIDAWVGLMGGLAGLAIGLASCDTPPTLEGSRPETQPEAKESPLEEVPADSPATAVSPSPEAETGGRVPVTVYLADSQCNLVEQKMMVSPTQPMRGAIAQILNSRMNTNFKVSNYQVNVADGVATVDLQASTEAERSFESLSSCEQTALFGSIQRTLMANAQWKIKDVRFTEKGEPLEY